MGTRKSGLAVGARASAPATFLRVGEEVQVLMCDHAHEEDSRAHLSIDGPACVVEPGNPPTSARIRAVSPGQTRVVLEVSSREGAPLCAAISLFRVLSPEEIEHGRAAAIRAVEAKRATRRASKRKK